MTSCASGKCGILDGGGRRGCSSQAPLGSLLKFFGRPLWNVYQRVNREHAMQLLQFRIYWMPSLVLIAS